MFAARRNGWWRFRREMEELRREAKQHLYATLYSREELQRDLQEAALVVRNLFACWVNDPSLLPVANQSQIAEHGRGPGGCRLYRGDDG